MIFKILQTALLLAFFAGISLFFSSCSSSKSISTSKKKQAAEKSSRTNVETLTKLQTEEAKDYFIQGASLQMQKRFAEAILEYQQALRLENSPAVYFAIAENYAELQKSPLAIDHLKKAVELDSNFTEAHKLLGDILISEYKIDEALTEYEIVCRQQPTFVNLFTMGRLYELKDQDHAIEIYNQLLEQEGDDYNVLLRLSDIYSRKGDLDKTVTIIEKLYQSAPENNAIPQALMEAYLRSNNFTKALDLLQSVETSVPSDEISGYYINFAGAILRQTDSMKFKEFAPKFIAKTENQLKDNWQTQLLSAMIASRLKDSTKAEIFYQRSLTFADTVIEAPLEYCIYKLQTNQFKHLSEVARKYAVKFPKESRFLFFLGIALSRIDSAKSAVAVLNHAVALDSNNIDIWIQLGIVQNSLKNNASSDSAYIKALDIDPKNPLVNNNYAYSLSERGQDLEKAKRMTEIALEAEPHNPSYLDTMGWIYFQIGNYSDAVKFIQQAIENGDASATVFEHLGDAFNKLGNSEKAHDAWSKSLQKEPLRESAKQRLNQQK